MENRTVLGLVYTGKRLGFCLFFIIYSNYTNIANLKEYIHIALCLAWESQCPHSTVFLK